MFGRLFLMFSLVLLQACSNTTIGEKLERSFDSNVNTTSPVKSTEAQDRNEFKEKKKIKLITVDNEKKNFKGNIKKDNSISNKDRFSQKSNNSIEKVIFTPRPYRIIIKLSGTNPSAPAEIVTRALRKAGVQFEVEKIERFEEKTLSKDSSLRRKGF